MNKRQIKKKYKRINGKNPPKYFTVAQMRKCSTNNTFNNSCAILFYAVENSAKKIGNVVNKIANAFSNLKVAKMLGVDLEEEAKREEEEKQREIYGNRETQADLLLRALGMELGESRAKYMENLLNE